MPVSAHGCKSARQYLTLTQTNLHMLEHDIHITEVTWLNASAYLIAIRTEVFINEQGVPADLEWDGFDESAKHLLAMNKAGQALACVRILPQGIIGRMAVLKPYRNQGIGRALLRAAIALSQQHNWHDIHLSAQTHAIGFYEQLGFRVIGELYMDAGIPHIDMHYLQPS